MRETAMLKRNSIKAYQLLAALLPVSLVSWPGHCNAQDTSNLFHVEMNKADGSYSIMGTGSVGVVFRARVAAKIDGRWWRSTDYQWHEVVESEITDELGVARQIIVTHGGIEGAPNLLCVLKIRPEALLWRAFDKSPFTFGPPCET